MTTLLDFHHEVVATARHIKDQTVADEGTGADVDGHVIVIGQEDCRLLVRPEDKYQSVNVGAVCARLLQPCFVAWVSEVYALITTDEAELGKVLEGYQGGSLKAAFAAGDPRVAEALAVNCFGPEGFTSSYIPYRYAVGRRVDWLKDVAQPTVVAYEDHPDHGDLQLMAAMADAYGDELAREVCTRDPRPMPERFAFLARMVHQQIPQAVVLLSTPEEILVFDGEG